MAKLKTIRGTNADDTLRGSAANDRILGYDGDDRLIGQGGDDQLEGGLGEDLLEGGEGNDRLNGGAGDDRLDGGAGNDRLAGGSGDDFYILTLGDEVGGEARGGGIDTIQAGFSVRLFENFENVILVGKKAINALGNNSNNSLTGNNAANILWGGRGNDTLIGNGGNDRLDGGAGRDLLIGGLGNDVYLVDHVRDRVREAANQGEDTIESAVNFSLTAAPHVENLVLVGTAFDGEGNDLDNELTGNSGTNTLRGGAGDDKLDGQGGSDSLLGEDGDDVLLGDSGNDNLNGGAGDDRLIGGSGNDVLVGGEGADEFVFEADTPFTTTTTLGQDVIGDFAAGFDTIVLDKDTFTAIDSRSGGRGFSDASEFAVVSSDSAVVSSRAIIVYNDRTDRLYYHPGGAGTGAALFAIFNGSPTLSAGDFSIES